MKVVVGIDDTDSQLSGCTTYVGYVLAKEIIKKWGASVFADFPRLVRLNPNIPFKTRGNAAVALELNMAERDVEELWDLTISIVQNLSRREGKTEPGVAMAVGEVPQRARILYRMALTQLVSLEAAERAGLRTWGGRGKIGAVAAVGADLQYSTFELITYHNGERKTIPLQLVKAMETLTYPFTFHNVDKTRVLIQPRGLDPVQYGVRGLTPYHLLYAKSILNVETSGWVIYRTNQATDAHIHFGVFYREQFPYSYYKARGLIVNAWRTSTRHLVGRLDTDVHFVVYRHMGKLASELEQCIMCDVELIGGLKPRRSRLYLYVERAIVWGQYVKQKPKCNYCGGSLESLGRGRGWRCRKCKTTYRSLSIRWLYDVSTRRYLIPKASEWRHLLKPPGLDVEIPNFFKPQDVEWIK